MSYQQKYRKTQVVEGKLGMSHLCKNLHNRWGDHPLTVVEGGPTPDFPLFRGKLQIAQLA